MPTLRQLCIIWLFPGVTLSMVVGNQLWELGPFLMGQIINWFNMLAAIIIIANNRRSIFVLFLFSSIFITKGLEIFSFHPYIAHSYVAFRCTLFCFAGAYIAIYHYRVIYKQLMVICLLNAPIMFFQVAGIGEWLQFFATENTTIDYRIVQTLFNPILEHGYSVIQTRPSGFLYSNNRLSQYIIFGFAMHLSIVRKRYWWGTFILCAMAVLSMAKIVFAGMAALILFILIAGRRHQKKWCLNTVITFSLLWMIYIYLFPGVYAHHLHIIKEGNSIYFRINELVSILPQGSIKAAFERILEGTPRAAWIKNTDSVLSGYAQLLKIAPIMVAIAIFLAPHYVRGRNKLSRYSPQLSHISTLVLIVFAVYPSAVPIFEAPGYWIMGGFAVLPFLTLKWFRMFPILDTKRCRSFFSPFYLEKCK